MNDHFADPAGASGLEDFGLVPSEFITGTSVPFIDRILGALGHGQYSGLSGDQAVREFVRGQPGLYEQIREVSAVAGGAGTRVRDSGQLRSSVDDNLKYYTPDELWCLDLAVDVIAMLALLPGVPGNFRFQMMDRVHELMSTLTGHHFHKEVKHAVDAPAAFRGLRSRVPVRPADPMKAVGGPGHM
jgi:hypothetical protein